MGSAPLFKAKRNDRLVLSQQGAAAQRLVNQTAVQPLTEASSRGECTARITVEPIALPPQPALRGRIGDQPLIQLLEKHGHALLGRRQFGGEGGTGRQGGDEGDRQCLHGGFLELPGLWLRDFSASA